MGCQLVIYLFRWYEWLLQMKRLSIDESNYNIWILERFCFWSTFDLNISSNRQAVISDSETLQIVLSFQKTLTKMKKRTKAGSFPFRSSLVLYNGLFWTYLFCYLWMVCMIPFKMVVRNISDPLSRTNSIQFSVFIFIYSFIHILYL